MIRCCVRGGTPFRAAKRRHWTGQIGATVDAAQLAQAGCATCGVNSGWQVDPAMWSCCRALQRSGGCGTGNDCCCVAMDCPGGYVDTRGFRLRIGDLVSLFRTGGRMAGRRSVIRNGDARRFSHSGKLARIETVWEGRANFRAQTSAVPANTPSLGLRGFASRNGATMASSGGARLAAKQRRGGAGRRLLPRTGLRLSSHHLGQRAARQGSDPRRGPYATAV